jgi:hypothetical protein
MALSAGSAIAAEFKVYDGLGYVNKPDLGRYGIADMRLIGPGDWWGSGTTHDRAPTRYEVQRALGYKTPESRMIMIDIEHWPIRGTDYAVGQTASKLSQILQFQEEGDPSLTQGLYAIIPARDYWRASAPVGSSQYLDWQKDNNRFAEVASKVEVLFPSLYTFYENRDGWKKYAIANINEARRMARGKPVYAVIWPQYHGSNPTVGWKYLPVDFWRMQLETVRQHADGVVFWGGWQQPWNENAAWWQETKNFMRTLETSAPAPTPVRPVTAPTPAPRPVAQPSTPAPRPVTAPTPRPRPVAQPSVTPRPAPPAPTVIYVNRKAVRQG